MKIVVKFLFWFIIERWKIKSSIKDWMLTCTPKYEQRKQYYFAWKSENYYGLLTNKLIRHDLQSMLQLKGKVND